MILLNLLHRQFNDQDLLKLCTIIITKAAPGSIEGKGLPIGNLTSQYFANFYLSHLDRYIKQSLYVKGYVRYMDDMILFADHLEDLKKLKVQIDHFVSHHLLLQLKASAERIGHSHLGIPFLGLNIYPKYMRLDVARRRRFFRQYSRFFRVNQNVNSDGERFIDHQINAQWNSMMGWLTLVNRRKRMKSAYIRRKRSKKRLSQYM